MQATSAGNMRAVHRDYVDSISRVKYFAHQNFVQQELDVPRLNSLDALQKQRCHFLLSNYTKRNPISHYIQSQALIAQQVIKTTESDETAFWLYTAIVEDVYPVGFYSHLLEPMVLAELFYRFLGTFSCENETVKSYFLRQFLCLFQEFANDEVRMAIFDFLLLLGSGCLTSTEACPDPPRPVSDEAPLCRTY